MARLAYEVQVGGYDLKEVMRAYYQEHVADFVDSRRFKTFIEEQTGLDLTTFFDQYVYGQAEQPA